MGFECGKFANPADFFMRILSINYPKKQADEEKLSLFKHQYAEKIE